MHRTSITLPAVALALMSSSMLCCGAPPSGPITPTPDVAEATGWKQEVVADKLAHAWSMAWLPDGAMLITLRAGSVLRMSPTGELDRTPIPGMPSGDDAVLVLGQGGLMEVAPHPEYSATGPNRWIYFTFAAGTRQANFTRLARAAYDGKAFTNWQTLFSVPQHKTGGQHFGSRILWLPREGDGPQTLLLTIGDGGNPPVKLGDANIRDQAQSRASALGKVLRLTDDGKPAPGNPFANDKDALALVYSYGHRNIQGIARDPSSGRIYANEHGARGGDELNCLEPAKNYGWPLATYSREYMGPKISENTTLDGMADPLVVWTPAQAPSGLAVVTGDRYPAWRGDLMSGGLVSKQVRRIDLDDAGKVIGEQRLTIGQRVRDVRMGPDGFLYVLTDDDQDGKLIRIAPST